LIGGTSALATIAAGCGVLGGYDFDGYRPRDGGPGGAGTTTATSTGGVAGAGGGGSSSPSTAGGGASPAAAGGGGSPVVWSGAYTIFNDNSGFALDDKDYCNTPPCAVQQYPYGGSKNQQWLIGATGDNSYTIMNRFNGLALEDASFSTANGA